MVWLFVWEVFFAAPSSFVKASLNHGHVSHSFTKPYLSVCLSSWRLRYHDVPYTKLLSGFQGKQSTHKELLKEEEIIKNGKGGEVEQSRDEDREESGTRESKKKRQAVSKCEIGKALRTI